MIKDVHMVVDLQFGSTGKGALAGLLGEYLYPDTVVTAWGPNAGHTFIGYNGSKYVHTMLANSMVCHSVHRQLIGPGSVVNMDSLVNECSRAGDAIRGKTIIIHPSASILQPRHASRERELLRIGSTMKGTAAAVVEKMWRDANLSPLARHLDALVLYGYRALFSNIGVELLVDEQAYDHALDGSTRVLIEGAQGFSLGVHTHFWPHTTSRDISPAQIMADCRLPFTAPFRNMRVWGTARTFPIRVANRYDEDGNMVGQSGPAYPGQAELDWAKDIGVEAELTTVTRLPRRVFEFSQEQVAAASRVCSPQVLALTFCDYIQERPAVGTRIGPELSSLLRSIRQSAAAPVRVLTFGPSISDAVLVDDADEVHWLNSRNFESIL